MPIYEYRCADCQHQFEKIVFRDQGPLQCPHCSSRDTEKLLSSFAVSSGQRAVAAEAGPCHCGAPRRGMCSEN